MTTEDDTFRRLKRIPFEEMRQKIADIGRKHDITYQKEQKLKREELEKFGWTLSEYTAEQLRDVARRGRYSMAADIDD